MKQIFLFALILGSCTPNSVNRNTIDKYPHLIDSLHLQSEYDSAKWRFYCIFCDDTLVIRTPRRITNKTFGQLDLKFEELDKQNDSIILYFHFYFQGEACSPEFADFKHDKPFTNGIVFVDKAFVAYTFAGSMFWSSGENKRFKDPLQPEVINYINNNKNGLDRWFRETAIQKKIIK